MNNQEGYQSFSQDNFDPNSLANATSSVIQFVVVLDVSPSIQGFQDAMNLATQEIFMQELKSCHRKDDIVIKAITFSDEVKHVSGFLPILNLQDDYLKVKAQGRGTALFQAVKEAFEHVTTYRTELEDQGVEVRTNIFIITDGEDNASHFSDADKVKTMVQSLRTNEAWASTFSITMLGVGNDASFKDACIEMGLDPTKVLSTIGTSASEIRKQMGVVSQSVSSSTASAGVSF